jgi:hypothetical protein
MRRPRSTATADLKIARMLRHLRRCAVVRMVALRRHGLGSPAGALPRTVPKTAKSATGGGEVPATAPAAALPAVRPRRRIRERVGKSKDPVYKLGSVYVLESVHDEVMGELVRPEVRMLLIRQFGRFRVRHAPKKAAYSDLVELLLKRWWEGLEKELEGGS